MNSTDDSIERKRKRKKRAADDNGERKLSGYCPDSVYLNDREG